MEYKFIDNDTLDKKSSLPWTEKYRPELLEQLVSHNDTKRILKKCINNNNFPHLILQGPPGTGKTTTILACAREMYGKSINSMVLELNGSDDRGIGIVREQINNFAENNNINFDIFNINKKQQKLIILDEADSMTSDAQFALRTVIESNTLTTRFCLICNYSEKISRELKSRCIQFRFYPIPFNDHLNYINNICNYENIKISNDVKNDIIKLSCGDMRRSINILQALKMTYDDYIDIPKLYNNICMPLPDELDNIIKNIFSLDLIDSFKYTEKLMIDRSLNVNDIIITLVNYLIKNKLYNIEKIANILINLSLIEQYLSINTNLSIQLCATISTIKI